MASRTAMIRARTTPDVKSEAEAIFASLGITATDAINIFYHQVALTKGLPFEVKLPNNNTRRAIEDARKGKNMTSYESSEALFEDLGI
jgi:DNA-damage-inducible protein J